MSNRSEHLIREEYPLPGTIEGIKALVGEVLSNPGIVQRMVIEDGQPVRVQRLVEADPMSEPALDLDGALRNSQMMEYTREAASLESISDIFVALREEGLHPVCWATGLNQDNLLVRWLGERVLFQQRGTEELFGVPLQRIVALPEDTLILCGAAFRDADYKDIKVTIKTAIEIRGDQDARQARSSTPAASRPGAGEHHPAAGAVEAPAAGIHIGSWAPRGYLVGRVGLGGKVRGGT